MSPEFLGLLRQAGDWANAIELRYARWNKELGRLDVHLETPNQLTGIQEQRLKELLSERFSAFQIALTISRSTAGNVTSVQQLPVQEERQEAEQKILLGKRIAQGDTLQMCDLREDSGRVILQGKPLSTELRRLNKNADSFLFQLLITDHTNTMLCKAFLDRKKAESLEKSIAAAQKEHMILRVRGNYEYDKFARDFTIRLDDIVSLPGTLRMDTAVDKRVELHLHTNMSAMDGILSVSDAIERAAFFGHPAIAITDHGVVQAFPEAAKAGKKHGVKVLFGVEGYLQADSDAVPMAQDYVVFDVETTGLRAEQGHIIEIGAVKISGGKIIDRYATFVDPGVAIPPNITDLTGIHDDMLRGAPHAREALLEFSAFSEDCILVAHNASFDIGFIREHGRRYDIPFNQQYADTLLLSRHLLFGVVNHKLETVCAHLGVTLANHHRAVDDAEATAEVFLALLSRIRELGVSEVPVHTELQEKRKGGKRQKSHHVVLLAQTQQGLKNLYRIISLSHLEFFHNKRPQIPKSLLRFYREGILVGSACEQGELFRAILQGKEDAELHTIASFYDYLEIQPMGNNAFLLREGAVPDDEGLRDFNRRIVEIGNTLQKPVVATGDVHFLEQEDAIYRAIIMNHEGFKDAHLQAPLYFKSTDEMLQEFQYLGEEEAHRVVVDAPNMLANSCEALRPYPDGTFAPKLENAEQELEQLALQRAGELYGLPLPAVVQARMDKELGSIISNGFSSLYLVARRLVKKSLSDGYLVGSRGSVGSSLVATMLGITEVNPLQPHYVCPACKASVFEIDRAKYATGVDMPDADCPHCSARMKKEGFDIPFEVFLGFNGDKTPDIDLNFSGEYQPVAHRFTEEMFGTGHAYRAGTISSIQGKTAYGYVKKYLEECDLQVSRQEMDRLCDGCSGVKRTTGQHPGGIVIVPHDNDILNFTPVQYPSDQQDKGTITTHFDFHALDDRLVKLDILGHVDPTALRMLQDLTGVDPREIPLDDPDTLELYRNASPLKADLTALNGCDIGSIGLPEFGTSFVRQMLKDTRPTTMEELVRIAGLSHGTDVWLNNAQDLVREGICTLSEAICTRDDIMNYLISCGCDPSMSFKIMENVRKGKGVNSDMMREMRMHDVPDWYINSCQKIKYMFPRAHAVAYVMMSFRIAYFKMHYPEAYYAVYYTTRADTFDVRAATGGPEKVLQEIKIIRKTGKDASVVDQALLTILEVVYEMNMRGIALLPVDVYLSHPTRFLIEKDGIRPPFSALAGIGETAAESIAKRIDGSQYVSIEDFQIRTGANSAAVAALEEAGCFSGFPRTNQISMF